MSNFHGSGGHGVGLGGTGSRGRGRRRGSRGAGGGPPELLDPGRERDRRRIMRLFAPYRARLAGVLALIVFSSGLSMISPFLLRTVLDHALPKRDGTLLTELVLGMIAIAIATSALSVVQTYISTA